MARLELWYPSKPHRVFQGFGESLACTEDKPELPLTKRKVVSKINGVCPAGYIELYPLLGLKGHPGEDLFAPDGQILRAPTDGIVKEINTEIERGLGVGIITEDRRDMDIYGEHFAKTRQWHLKSIFVSLNQKVKVGDPIGLADSTGLSAGSHNHFELKPVEYDNDGSHYNVFQNNGFYGAINPALYWNGYYAEDAQVVVSIYSKIIELLKKAIFSLTK